MSFFSWLFGRTEPRNAVHLRAMRSTIVDLRKAVAITEAALDWWSERRERAARDLSKWEARIAGTHDPELRQTVRLIAASLRGDISRAENAIATCEKNLKSGESQLIGCSSTFTVSVQREAAYGYDVSRLRLELDEEVIRSEAKEKFLRDIPDEPTPEDVAFAEQIFQRRECQADKLN